MVPQLKGLQQESQETPVSEDDSIASSASLRNGPVGAHPYRPDGEAREGPSFELDPSVATQAPRASGIDESLDVTPFQDAVHHRASCQNQYRL